MSQPTQGDVHVNRPLTNISVAYMQDQTNFIADQVFPNIPVSQRSDLYYMYDRGFFNRDEMAERAPGTEASGSGYEVEVDTPYYCKRYSFKHDIPDERRANADEAIQPDREATQLVTYKALIRRERLWASRYFTGTNIWTNNRTGHASNNDATNAIFWNLDSSTPIENVRAAMTAVLESTGFLPNTLVLGRKVYDALQDHPDIVDRIKYGQTAPGAAVVDTSELQALFKVPRILVSQAIYNSADEGATNNHQFISGSNALLTYSAPNPGLMTPTGGYTFSWTGLLGSQAQGQRIRRFRMDNIDSDRVEIDMSFDQKLISADLGFFWNAIVQ